jgi:hypothetical protein
MNESCMGGCARRISGADFDVFSCILQPPLFCVAFGHLLINISFIVPILSECLEAERRLLPYSGTLPRFLHPARMEGMT